MDILIGFLIVLEVLVCILLILIVLMQRPRQEGLGAAFGGGMMDSLAGAQTTSVLQKGTTYLGVTLFVLTTLLASIISHRTAGGADKKSFVKESDKPIPAETATPPAAPATTTAAPAPATTKPADAKPASTPAPAAPTPKPAAPAPTTTPPAAPTNVIPVPTTPPVPPPAPAPGSAPAK